MSLKELDLILEKDPVITTWPASALRSRPAEVEQDYRTHAKTHLPFGQTDEYVSTIFRWVSGANKGTFIGAVEGNYGEGKTSFLVHVWSQSSEKQVFAVPPFEWTSLADAIDGVAAWMHYVLGSTHPALAKKSERLHEEFKQATVEAMAKETAKETGQDYEVVLATLRALWDQGKIVKEVSPTGFLDYCAQVTEIVQEAGYVGLLVLLDEPEVAAKKVGRETVTQWLFELANELKQRKGNYGVFLSMPSNFLAVVLSQFAALSARLQARKCFPRLRDLYGSDFAGDLWARYSEEFHLGDEAERVVSPAALQAIGQVGSAERPDLSYGPRTVVSAFNQMVFRYLDSGTTYEPKLFVQDVLDD